MMLSADLSKIIDTLPFRPKGGTYFLFSSGLDKQKKEDWKAYGYRWRNNGNKKKTIFIENTEFIIVKKFFKFNSETYNFNA